MSVKIVKSDKLKFLSAMEGGYKLYSFVPSARRLFPKSGAMRKMDARQRLRFLLLLTSGYRVYVLTNDADDAVGCAVFANGKARRFSFADKNDLVCGPYFIQPEYRNRGLAAKMLGFVIENYETEYRSIFAHIWHTNIASIKCMAKLGFERVDALRTTKYLQKFVSDPNGKIVLVEKKR